MAYHIGSRLGNYRLIRSLGDGGFAEVYLGEHLHLGTYAAIKTLKPQWSMKVIDSQRFLHEARMMASFKHEHIVQILDFALDGNTPYLVMEYAQRGTVRQRYPRGVCLATSYVLDWIKQITSALSFVHQSGQIHQDVKPENLLLNQRDEILLSDFGIAFTAQQQGFLKGAGTIDYMAPEQILGKPCPASDQYALGVVIYEWLCGICPFTGNSRQEIAAKHRTLPPPSLRTFVPGITSAIEDVVLRALAKDPQARFQDMTSFAQAFETACQMAPIGSSNTTANLSLTVGTVPMSPPDPLQTIQNNSPTSSIPPTIPATPGQGFPPTERASSITSALPSVVGKQGETYHIFREHSDYVRAVTWSLDGKRIASAGDDQLVHIWNPIDGSIIYTYTGHSDQVRALAWEPTGERIVSGSASQDFQVWEGTNGKKLLTYEGHVGNAIGLGLACAASWSFDGQWIASGGADWTVHVWNAATGDVISEYHDHKGDIHSIAWSRDGTRIASASYDSTIHIWDIATGKTLLTYTRHTKPVWSLSWSLDGTHIASASDDETVHVWNATSGEQGDFRIYRSHTRRVRAVAWSLDGMRIASAGSDQTVHSWNPDPGHHLYTYHGHTRAIHALTWSPDGQFIASAGDDLTVRVWQTV